MVQGSMGVMGQQMLGRGHRGSAPAVQPFGVLHNLWRVTGFRQEHKWLQ